VCSGPSLNLCATGRYYFYQNERISGPSKPTVPKKTRRNDSTLSGDNFLDYPENMSMYERESLAAESILAERAKKPKPKKEKKKTIGVRVVPPKSVPISETDTE
jgi:hypothetical protein